MSAITILTAARSWGGMEVHTTRLVEILAGMGHEVTLVDGGGLYRSHCTRTSNVTVVNRPIVQSLPLVTFTEAIKILSGQPGDICLFPKGCFEQGNWSIDLAARLFFRTYVIIEHLASGPFPERTTRKHLGGVIPGIGLWWYRRRLELYLNRFFRFRLPDRIICVSSIIQKQLTQNFGFSADKVVTVHNGIDSLRFAPSPAFREKARKSWDVPSQSLVFGCLGRLHEIKGFDTALKSFHATRKANPGSDIWLVIAGEGPERETLAQMAADLNIVDRVRFAGFTSTPWELYPGFDVFLMPSRNEGMPLALLEAMSCGCLPIAMDVGGIPEVIQEEAVGLLIPNGNTRSFAEAMCRCAEMSPELLQHRGEKARAHILGNFNGEQKYREAAEAILSTDTHHD
ncbi:glycosyltransferase [Geomesophilobacter sediminis]|uniref:Glycosyltransferase n=1 Tax=Geomesophilobacter sediminis TaxID=2798584 RepID=A0A8J7SCD6_9BACT|nr:glycosyltransferase [Geomesophilobacter sediminis]MBJ6727094.1 glycosyltransferase [Geomesophilobacter sediminis]